MIRIIQNITISLLLLTIVSCSAATAPELSSAHHVSIPSRNEGSDEFERIKALKGKWMSKTSMFGTKDQEVFTEYSVTAGGSAVIEKIFPGTEHEMVSVYFDDDSGKLAMTHYCIMQNRPHFVLAKSTPDVIKLDVAKIEGLKSKGQPSMGAITLKFEDENNFVTSCEGSSTSDKKEPMKMRYTRVIQ